MSLAVWLALTTVGRSATTALTVRGLETEVTLERPQLRPGGGITRRFTGLLVAAVIGALGLGSAPAAAGGSGPERPPVSAPAKLTPEPAPVATQPAAPVASVRVTRTANPQSGATGAHPATSARPAAVTSAAPAQHRPAQARVTKPKLPPPAVEHNVIKRVKSLTLALERPAVGLRFVIPQTQSSDSNRLLFVGGLALLVLVLGDASLLALSARFLREPAERYRETTNELPPSSLP